MLLSAERWRQRQCDGYLDHLSVDCKVKKKTSVTQTSNEKMESWSAIYPYLPAIFRDLKYDFDRSTVPYLDSDLVLLENAIELLLRLQRH